MTKLLSIRNIIGITVVLSIPALFYAFFISNIFSGIFSGEFGNSHNSSRLHTSHQTFTPYDIYENFPYGRPKDSNITPSELNGILSSDSVPSCNDQPGCISSADTEEDERHYTVPIYFSGKKAAAREALIRALVSHPNTITYVINDTIVQDRWSKFFRFRYRAVFKIKEGYVDMTSMRIDAFLAHDFGEHRRYKKIILSEFHRRLEAVAGLRKTDSLTLAPKPFLFRPALING